MNTTSNLEPMRKIVLDLAKMIWSLLPGLFFLVAMSASAKDAVARSGTDGANSVLSSSDGMSLWGQEDEDLGGNYKLVGMMTGRLGWAIHHTRGNVQEVTIPAKVTSPSVRSPYVVGHTTAVGARRSNDVPKAHAGWFLLNTATDERKEGLTELQLQSELERIGWQRLPARLGDYQTPLCGDYSIVRTNAAEVTISNLHKPIEPVREVWHGRKLHLYFGNGVGNVRKLAVHAPYVTGYTTVLRGDHDPDAKANAGFFLLNTATDERKVGLTEREWFAKLEGIGWHSPQLDSPPL
jgi:hypothetical protein